MSRRPGSKELLSVARREEPADISIIGGKVFSPSTKEWIETGLAIKNGLIVGWGDHKAHEVIDVRGAYVAPGFIDSYASLESSKLWVDSFAETVLPRGTTAVAADPHQLASIFGVSGIEELTAASNKLPFTFGFYASSNAQSTQFDTTGQHAGAVEIAQLIRDHGAIGVGGILNHNSVVSGDDDVLAIIAAARNQKVVGHAHGISNRRLDAYLLAGVESDVSCQSYSEALEKLRKGMWIMLNSNGVGSNLGELLPLVTRYGPKNMVFCTGECETETMLTNGHIDECLRSAIAHGIAPEDALILASTNPAEFHGFSHLGYLSPGYQADLVVLPNLEDFQPSMVFQKGRLVARSGKIMVFSVPKVPPSAWMFETVLPDISRITPDSFSLPAPLGQRVTVIHLNNEDPTPNAMEKEFSRADRNIGRLSVLGRKNSGKDVGVALIEGFGLVEGALATTVARGPHSMMVVGAASRESEADMAFALTALSEMRGGQIVVRNGEVLASLPLPIGGIISTASAERLKEQQTELVSAAQQIGNMLHQPFRRLESLAPLVMPELRITSMGSMNVLNLVHTGPSQFD